MARDKNLFLISAEAAPLIGWSPYTLTLMARTYPDKLPFPVLVHGKRVQIPTAPFMEYLKSIRNGEETQANID